VAHTALGRVEKDDLLLGGWTTHERPLLLVYFCLGLFKTDPRSAYHGQTVPS